MEINQPPPTLVSFYHVYGYVLLLYFLNIAYIFTTVGTASHFFCLERGRGKGYNDSFIENILAPEVKYNFAKLVNYGGLSQLTKLKYKMAKVRDLSDQKYVI